MMEFKKKKNTEFLRVSLIKQYYLQITVYDLSAWGRDTVFKNYIMGPVFALFGERGKGSE